MHREMEMGIIVLYGMKQFTYGYFCSQLLTYLTTECLFGTLSYFYLTTRELPPVFPFAISSLGGKYFAAIADDCGNYFYLFHISCRYTALADSRINPGIDCCISQMTFIWHSKKPYLCLFNRISLNNFKLT